MRSIYFLLALLSCSSVFAATEAPARFTVVASLEDEGTSVYDFKERAFKTNPVKMRKDVDILDQKKVTDKACLVSKHIGKRVWVVKMDALGNTTTCEGADCCK